MTTPTSRPFAQVDVFVSGPLSGNPVAVVLDAVSTSMAQFPQDDLDGLTVDCGSWWFNLRPSNTEPLLRLNAEGHDRATMERVRDEVLSTIRSQG